jgi:acetyl-CoA synthetase
MLARTPGVTYDDLRARFAWELPARFNMGVACADRHPADDLAMIDVRADGERAEYSFGDLARLSSRLANGLHAIGIGEGDPVGIVLPQRIETGLAHLALYKLGAVAVPMSILFGPQALTYRLGDSGAKAVVTDGEHREVVSEVAAELGSVTVIVADDGAARPHRSFWELVGDGAAAANVADTTPDTPALLIYTSGTTGAPKGALHGHRVLLGHLPGFELSHNFFPQPGDRFWTPADWAWIGGLMDALMPSWFHGRGVIAASRGRFDPEWALRLVEETQIRNVFLPPTVLKLMRQSDVSRPGGSLRSVMCGGEPLGEEMLAWAQENLGVTINEIYGQTEANYVVGNCHEVWDVRSGSMGRPYPGHDVAVIGADGESLRPGEVGELAVGVPDPVTFLEYWGAPEATRDKFTPDGRWLRTGDLGRMDEDGYLWFESRRDDVINSAGYRIGPAEIEECLMHHRAVAMSAVVGVPDEVRGQAVKAFIQLAEGHEPSPELEEEIRQLVRRNLAAYEYPRHLEFVDELPLTATGKIRRADLRRREEERQTAPSPDSA